MITRTCPACQGAGQVIRERCLECRGQGRIEREKTIELRIPPGVDSGTRLRVAGEGESGPNGGPPGDLYVVLEVKEHPFFERRGADLYCTIPISMAQAALGAELVVPGLTTEEKLKSEGRWYLQEGYVVSRITTRSSGQHIRAVVRLRDAAAIRVLYRTERRIPLHQL